MIPRFGIPSEISSDNGSAFVQKVAKGILQQLRIKQRCGAVYHSQSQWMGERINGTYRMQTHRFTHLTPHEMLTGQPMPAPQLRGPFKGPPLEQLQTELKA